MRIFDELVHEFENDGADVFRAAHTHCCLIYVPPDVQAASVSTRRLLTALGVVAALAQKGGGISPVVFELVPRDPNKDEVAVGRSRDADVTVPLPRISKTHASVRKDGRGGFILVDGGSKNGTAIAGSLLSPGQQRGLKNGDAVELGPYSFRFYTPEGFVALCVECSGTGSVDIGDLQARRGDSTAAATIVVDRSANSRELEEELSRPSTDSAALPLVPKVAPNTYEVVRRIGVGGMADVVLAKRLGPGGFAKLVAMKRILPQYAANEHFVQMFVQEARIAARVNHPNVVQIFELGETAGQYFITMEYVEGSDLSTILRVANRLDRELPLPIVCRIGADMCAGLHAAHICEDETGRPLKIVHRDISPHNILITNNCTAKIADFGVSRAADSLRHTKTGELKGKIIYMAPEQVESSIGEIDARTDVYALGLTIYEMLTGIQPLRRANEVMALQAALEASVPDVAQRRKDIPPRLAKAIMKALQRNPADRWQTAQEFQYEIEGVILDENLTATQMGAAAFLRELKEHMSDAPPASLARPEDKAADRSAVTARVTVEDLRSRPPKKL